MKRKEIIPFDSWKDPTRPKYTRNPIQIFPDHECVRKILRDHGKYIKKLPPDTIFNVIIDYYYFDSMDLINKNEISEEYADDILYILILFYKEYGKAYHEIITLNYYLKDHNDKVMMWNFYKDLSPDSFVDLAFGKKNKRKQTRIFSYDILKKISLIGKTYEPGEKENPLYIELLKRNSDYKNLTKVRAECAFFLKCYLDKTGNLKSHTKNNITQSKFIGELLKIWEIIPKQIFNEDKPLYNDSYLHKGVEQMFRTYKNNKIKDRKYALEFINRFQQ